MLVVSRANDPVPAWLALFLLLLVSGLLFFSRLHAPLLEPQEVRYAEIPWQMLAQGQFLVPVLHGEPYLDKPPLLYWAVMASYRVFGVHDWSARIVPGIAGVLIVLSTYFWGRHVFGGQAAICGALILCLTPEFIYRARMLTFDTLLALWVVLALASAHAALAAPSLRRGWWVVSALAGGLGLLTKGPVALVLVAGPLLAARLFCNGFARPGLRAWAVYLVISIGTAAPWYLAVMQAMPDFAGYFFWKHNVVRFFAPFDHAGPPWYYLPGLLTGMLPWTLLLPGLVVLLVRRTASSPSCRPSALRFVVLGFAWMLLFFSAAGCKRPTYILPALPPLALSLGWYVYLRAPSWKALCRDDSRLATAAAVVVLLAGAGISLTAGTLRVVKPQLGMTLAGVALAALAGLALLPRRLSWAGSGGIAFAALLLGVQYLLPAYNRQFALRGQLRRAGLSEPGRHPVVCYPQRFDSVSFYLPESEVRTFGTDQRRELIAHLRDHPGTLLLVKSGSSLQQLMTELPPEITFRTQQRGGPITVGRIIQRIVIPDPVLVRR